MSYAFFAHRRAKSDAAVATQPTFTRARLSFLRLSSGPATSLRSTLADRPAFVAHSALRDAPDDAPDASDASADADSLFSTDGDATEPLATAAQALVRELEAALSAFALKNEALRAQLRFLRGVVYGLARELASARTRAEVATTALVAASRAAALKASVPAPAPAPAPVPASRPPRTRKGSTDSANSQLDMLLSAFPPSPASEVFHSCATSRSSSEAHGPADRGRSRATSVASSAAPLSAVSAAYGPAGRGRSRAPSASSSAAPHTAGSTSRDVTPRSSAFPINVSEARHDPPFTNHVPKQRPVEPAAVDATGHLLAPVSISKRSTRSSILPFFPSRSANAKPPRQSQDDRKSEADKPRPSMHSIRLPARPRASGGDPVMLSPPDPKTKLPTLSKVQNSARRLRDTIRRRSLRPAETPLTPPVSAQ